MKAQVLSIIGFYQRRISPGRPAACRYLPTCSHYSYEAIETRGLIYGSLLAAWRLIRCNPFSRGGYDPVPKREDNKYSSSHTV